MNKKASEQVKQANKANSFSDMLKQLEQVKKQARVRDSEIAKNKQLGYATLTKQANKNSKAGFSYIIHNANILSEQVLKALECNASERARLDANKASFMLKLSESELAQFKIKLANSLNSEHIKSMLSE